jgi:hypothetical protein
MHVKTPNFRNFGSKFFESDAGVLRVEEFDHIRAPMLLVFGIVVGRRW